MVTICLSEIIVITSFTVIYYQGEQSDIPFIGEEVFKELEGDGEISRIYEALNISASAEDLQMNGKLIYRNNRLLGQPSMQSFQFAPYWMMPSSMWCWTWPGSIILRSIKL